MFLYLYLLLLFFKNKQITKKKKKLQRQIEKQGFAFFPITMTVSLLENQNMLWIRMFSILNILSSVHNVWESMLLILCVSLYPQPNHISCSVETYSFDSVSELQE